MQSFIELVLTQKFADMPGWIDCDLTVSQVRTIYFLTAHERLTVTILAQLLGMGKPATRILVQQLVERQLVYRSDDRLDRRRVWIHLTESGSELVSGRRELRERKFEVWLGKLSGSISRRTRLWWGG
jgi:DNA-binding MarR family transcriptional regulator